LRLEKMSIVAGLQDERGRPLEMEDAVIEFPLLTHNYNFKVLLYIDPYGDTYFNCLQMDDFIKEWMAIEPKESLHWQYWNHVHQMATRCRATPHLYLKFIGD
jgi:hypothetical protein